MSADRDIDGWLAERGISLPDSRSQARSALEEAKIINPKKVIPIHYNDYEVFKSPLEDFKRAAAEAGLSERMIYLSHGETYDFEVPASRWQQSATP